ncbi:SDR family NAD(P)-dependent oxidoreductase [Pseudomonas synxantha]|uniref:SDR family NAD(P)-dependent oxidoreductase n=1 Tax=Pseudomonas synxantha TaxID=47883 RepID=UPI000F5806B6|nr:SDR family oxidoreductase [Pseudomonas synxantha]AZE80636.1 3-oxoacyl-ACP reductase [Pseudomonas synxantha]
MSDNTPVTLITGTRKGIGRHLAEHYLAQGHRVIGCSRSSSDLSHPAYHHFIADVADEQAISELMSHVRGTCGRLDHLINNAGIASMNHSLLTPYKTAQNIMQTNVLGTFLLSREAAKLMRAGRQGRIVNFSTVAKPLKLEGEALYAASKAAVETLTCVMAKELASFGITVNAVGPTPIDTDLTRVIPAQKMKDLLAQQSLKRFGTFDDVTNVADFFLSPRSNFITGQVVYLGGL